MVLRPIHRPFIPTLPFNPSVAMVRMPLDHSILMARKLPSLFLAVDEAPTQAVGKASELFSHPPPGNLILQIHLECRRRTNTK